MSTSTLYAVFKTTTRAVAEYRNGWGTGPAIWGHLLEKYLNKKESAWLFGDVPELWDLAHDTSVPLSLRACLVMTLDGAVVIPTDTSAFAELLIQGGQAISSPNHFQAIGRSMLEARVDRRAIGLALNCTSVSDIWIHYPRVPRTLFDAYQYLTSDTPSLISID